MANKTISSIKGKRTIYIHSIYSYTYSYNIYNGIRFFYIPYYAISLFSIARGINQFSFYKCLLSKTFDIKLQYIPTYLPMHNNDERVFIYGVRKWWFWWKYYTEPENPIFFSIVILNLFALNTQSVIGVKTLNAAAEALSQPIRQRQSLNWK